MGRLIRISKVKNDPNFPLKAATLYKWRTLNRHPEIFTTLGGCVFVDLQRLNELIEANRGKAA